MSAPATHPCEQCKPRRIRFSRWGLAEDPIGAQVIVSGRLFDVESVYRREFPAAVMLRLRHFNGEDGGECAAAAALILPRHYHEEKSFD